MRDGPQSSGVGDERENSMERGDGKREEGRTYNEYDLPSSLPDAAKREPLIDRSSPYLPRFR